LCALRAAHYVASQGLPIDVGILWETEEEIGSPHFGEIVDAKREVLSCDAVIVSDTIWPSDTQPAISIGLRGSLQTVLRLRTGGKHAHSGLVGGAARNPVRELCKIASAVHDATFWRDGVEPPSDAEIDGFLRSGFDLDYFKRAHDLHRLESEVPLEVMLAIWARPTFEVHGIVGGHMGPGVKTVVPAAGELKASFRLLPGQDPVEVGKQLQAFVAAINPDVDVEIAGYLAPYAGRSEGRIHDAIAAGLRAATGIEPVTVREGGSIGAVPILAEKLGVAVHFLPLSLPDHGYHAPNEYFDWRQAKVGIAAWIHTFTTLAS
jgi:acetylornithine deacetylase/succinyl-diaminopimelate desuccinylase-like protein